MLAAGQPFPAAPLQLLLPAAAPCCSLDKRGPLTASQPLLQRPHLRLKVVLLAAAAALVAAATTAAAALIKASAVVVELQAGRQTGRCGQGSDQCCCK